jgi:hypothetical protein
MKDSINRSRKWKKWIVVFAMLFFVFIGIQFIRPNIPHPAITGDLTATVEVKSIFRRSCYNCHSNETQLSWYDKIVPVYWQVRDHIVDGRNVLNFSEWDKLAPADQEAKMWESVNQIMTASMPLSAYTFVHRSARITAEDLQVLKNYISGLPVLQAGDSQKIENLREQILHENEYQDRKNIPVALNGIAFIPDYKNWQPVSSTERYDNGTLRVIVGNDVAIKAITEGNTNPWPEGTIFGKITWDELRDSMGITRTGAFKQVEFMIKDSKKYNDTRNWGFARFKTTAMLPYGKNKLFASECVNCHQPMKEHDFVFTVPFQTPFDSREFKLKSSFVNQKDASMSILYGGKGLYKLATWKQKPDEHWFGANIPGNLLSVDTVGGISTEKLSVLP